MKFDTVIIGGGLSGLTSGIQLAEKGQRCAIVSSGQSAMHFFAGSFDLLGRLGEAEVANPIEAISGLPAKHPYRRIGSECVARFAEEASGLLNRAGLNVQGQADKNHFVLTPMGTFKPTWLTLDDFTCFDQKDVFPYKRCVVLNFTGFLDFHALFIKEGLEKFGVDVEIKEVAMEQFEAIRRNPCEMRSSNIAKVFDVSSVLNEFTQKVNSLCSDAEAVILPAVFGLFKNSVTAELKSKVTKPVILVPAVPPSTPGVRSQIMLRKRFQELGGTYFLGDHVTDGTFKANKLKSISTENHGDISLDADNFILATGSFYSKGIVATPESIHEPIFGLDIDGNANRSGWFDEKIFNDQPFMHYGVKTDDSFRAVLNGEVVQNLYVAGSVNSGANPIKEGSGAGLCLVTSLYTAEQILR